MILVLAEAGQVDELYGDDHHKWGYAASNCGNPL